MRCVSDNVKVDIDRRWNRGRLCDPLLITIIDIGDEMWGQTRGGIQKATHILVEGGCIGEVICGGMCIVRYIIG